MAKDHHGLLEGVTAAREDAGVFEDCRGHVVRRVVRLNRVIELNRIIIALLWGAIRFYIQEYSSESRMWSR